MLRITVSGIAKQEIARAAQAAGGNRVQVTVLSDIEAAKAVKEGRADALIGSCATGMGGALAMAVALLGRERCATAATAARTLRPDEIKAKVTQGIIAFGLVPDAVEEAVPAVVAALLAR